MQSPGIEHSPLIREATEIIGHENDIKNGKSEERNEEKKDHGSEKTQVKRKKKKRKITKKKHFYGSLEGSRSFNSYDK